MKKPVFKLTRKDNEMMELMAQMDQKTLALWAIDCASRVLPFFQKQYPNDNRPQEALHALAFWIATGKFSMATIRGASLASHAAAREVGDDTPARSAARAAGQAVATAHVRTHAYGAALYAQQAIFRATEPSLAEEEVKKERDWQYRNLLDRKNTHI